MIREKQRTVASGYLALFVLVGGLALTCWWMVRVIMAEAVFGIVASALLATGVARLLSFDPDAVRAGLFGYNALLVGLGVAALLPLNAVTIGLGVLGVVASVLATAAVRSALGATWGLPALTLPFLSVFYLLLDDLAELVKRNTRGLLGRPAAPPRLATGAPGQPAAGKLRLPTRRSPAPPRDLPRESV